MRDYVDVRMHTADFRARALAAFRDQLIERDLARTTVNHYVSTVRRMFQDGTAWCLAGRDSQGGIDLWKVDLGSMAILGHFGNFANGFGYPIMLAQHDGRLYATGKALPRNLDRDWVV